MKKLRQNLGRLISICSLFYIILVIKKIGFEHFSFLSVNHLTNVFITAFVLQIAVLLLVGTGWKQIIDVLSRKKNPLKSILHVHLKASVAKYLPGNIFEFVARTVLSKRLDVSVDLIVVSSIVEAALGVANVGLLIFVAHLYGLKILSNLPQYDPNHATMILAAGFVAGLALLAFIKHRYFKSIRLMNLESIMGIVRFLVLNLLILVISSSIFYLFLSHTEGFSDHIDFFQVAISFLIAYFAGYLIPGAPGGIGIRESALLFLFQPFAGAEQIMIAALWCRLINILGDVCGYFLSFAFVEKKTEKNDA